MKNITGPVHNWKLDGKERRYTVITLPYAEARQVIKPKTYSALSGQGEQRELSKAHARALRRAIESGEYTPAAFGVGLRNAHRDNLEFQKDGSVVVIPVETPLASTDGNHRMNALALLREDVAREWDAAEKNGDAESASRLSTLLGEIDDLPITFIVQLDGNVQRDFVNLQLGKTMDRSHLQSIAIQTKMVSKKDYPLLKSAFTVAKALHGRQDSHLYNLVKFDSKSMAPIPVSSLLVKGADVACSLYGLAKVAHAGEKKDEAWMADVVAITYDTLKERTPGLLGDGMVLEPPPQGSRGGASLLVGIATVVAYRAKFLNNGEITKDDLTKLVSAACDVFDVPRDGNTSSQRKRALLGEFAGVFFSDVETKKHEGVPLGLFVILTASALGRSAPGKTLSDDEDFVPPELEREEAKEVV